MTLGRLMELYLAEQQGKQIMRRVFVNGYYESDKYISEIKLLDEELKDLVFGRSDDNDSTYTYTYTYFIKDEEDEYGNKIKKNESGGN